MSRPDPAATGSDPAELSALLARALGEADAAMTDEARLTRRAPQPWSAAPVKPDARAELRHVAQAWSAVAQAAATGLLAARVAQLVAVVEADHTATVLPFPEAGR